MTFFIFFVHLCSLITVKIVSLYRNYIVLKLYNVAQSATEMQFITRLYLGHAARHTHRLPSSRHAPAPPVCLAVSVRSHYVDAT